MCGMPDHCAPIDSYVYKQQLCDQLFVDYFSRPITGALAYKELTYPFSGLGILKKLKSTDKVLDVGCGRNLFKPYVRHLVGIDPISPYADINCYLEQFVTTDKFNVVFCFGVLHFGDEDIIKSRIDKIKNLLAPGGKVFLRNKVTITHNWQFPWSIDLNNKLCKEFGFKTEFVGMEKLKHSQEEKLFSEWVLSR